MTKNDFESQSKPTTFSKNRTIKKPTIDIENKATFWKAGPLDRKTRREGGWIKMAKEEQQEYAPEPLCYSKKVTGVAFHRIHEAEKTQLFAKFKSVFRAKFMHKASDQTDLLVCEDSNINCLVMLAILRGAAIVRPSYVYECERKGKPVPTEAFEVSYFPKKSERKTDMSGSLKDLRFSIDVFPGSSNHQILCDPMLEYVISEMGGILVRKNSYGDFIISDRAAKFAMSSIFKKVDFNWLVDSLLKNKLQPVENYYF